MSNTTLRLASALAACALLAACRADHDGPHAAATLLERGPAPDRPDLAAERELRMRSPNPAPAWVGWDANAGGRFNVNLAGVAFNDPCAMTP